MGAMVDTCEAKLDLGLCADLDQLLGGSSLSQDAFPAIDGKMGAVRGCSITHLLSLVKAFPLRPDSAKLFFPNFCCTQDEHAQSCRLLASPRGAGTEGGSSS